MKTTRKMAYLVQPYRLERGGYSYAQPLRLESQAQALRKAEDTVGPVFVGADVLEMEVAPECDYCGEPRLIASYGEVPEMG